MFDEFELIHRYTRKQAIADGTLIDVTGTAREAGIQYPTAITATVWGQCVMIPTGVEAQDETGRLWDIIWLLRMAILKDRGGDRLLFQVHVRNDNREPVPVTLKAICGPDDDGSPCITILFPGED